MSDGMGTVFVPLFFALFSWSFLIQLFRGLGGWEDIDMTVWHKVWHVYERAYMNLNHLSNKIGRAHV